MAEPIKSPIGGGIRAVRRNVSASMFTGGGVIKQQNDGGTAAAVNRNAGLLSNISTQVDSISQQTIILNKSLEVISSNLTAGAALDRKREAENAVRQRRLAKQGLIDSKENAIETGIRNAIMAPVKNIGKKVQIGLGKLVNVFFLLTGGWLINKTIDMLRALSGDNQEKFVKIRNDLLKGLLVIGGVVALATAGMGALTLGLGKLGMTLATVTAVGLLGAPLTKLKNAILGIAKKALDGFSSGKGGGNVAGSTNVNPDKTTKTKGGTTPKKSGGVLGKTASSAGKISILLTSLFGAKNVLEGKPFMYEVVDQGMGYGGGAVGGMIGAKIPGPPWFKALAGVITSIIFFSEGYKFRGGVQDAVGAEKLTELQNELEQGSDVMPGAMSPITDQDLLNEIVNQRPRREDFGASRSGSKRYKESLEEFEAANADRILELHNKIKEQKPEPIRNSRGRITGYKTDAVKIEPSTSKKEQTKNLSKELGSLEEPPANIIPFPSMSEDADPNAAEGNVAAGGVGGGVPVIPASNKDNSYVFLAFKNYQVVPT
tara:strand:+ start:380 stop:2011 length:1632 start_codon:yes stop_codon:yes gene_type:complete